MFADYELESNTKKINCCENNIQIIKKHKTYKREARNPFFVTINDNIDLTKYTRVYTLHIKNKDLEKIKHIFKKIYNETIFIPELKEFLNMLYLKKK